MGEGISELQLEGNVWLQPEPEVEEILRRETHVMSCIFMWKDGIDEQGCMPETWCGKNCRWVLICCCGCCCGGNNGYNGVHSVQVGTGRVDHSVLASLGIDIDIDIRPT